MRVKITSDVADMTAEEAARYVEEARKRIPAGDALEEIIVTASGDGGVDVSYRARSTPFERIRRITGYLVGTLDRWNDAKKSEERERVKHGGDNNEDLPRMQRNF